MKRHGSVLMLAARGSLGKALLVCAATAAAGAAPQSIAAAATGRKLRLILTFHAEMEQNRDRTISMAVSIPRRASV